MSEIDFSEAPEGATHYIDEPTGIDWYSESGLCWYRWFPRADSWVICDKPNDLLKPIHDFVPLVSVEGVQPATGSKHDSGKPLMGAVPPAALLAVARVLTFGAQKYGRDNWRMVENAYVRYLDAALRHLNAHQCGQTVDPESGESHLAHAVCSLMFMLEMLEGE